MPKYGEIRQDGKIFFCIQKQRKKDGSFGIYECWLSQESFQKQKIKRKIALKKWKDKNKDKQKSYQKKYRKGNGKINYIKTTNIWKKKNKEKVNEHTYKWRHKNPGKVAQNRFLRRTNNNSPELTNDEKMLVNEIYKFSNLCQKILGIKYHVDHVIPVSLGGTNHPSNLRVIPASMNLKKGNKLNEITLA